MATTIVIPGAAAALSRQPRVAQLIRMVGGDPSADPAREGFGTIGSITISPNGQIAVFDGAECHVKLLAADGTFQKSFGRRGPGPGEFSCRVVGLSSNDSLIEVTDASNALKTLITRDGRFLSATNYSAGLSKPLRYGFRVYVQTTWSRTAANPDPKSYVILARDSTRFDTVAKIRGWEVLVTLADGRRFGAPSGAGVGAVYKTLGDSVVAVVDAIAGTATWYQITTAGLRQQRVLRLPIELAQLSAADKRALLAKVRESKAVKTDVKAARSPVVSISSIPDTWSPLWTALFSEDDELWIGLEDRAGRRTDWIVIPHVGEPFPVRFPETFSLGTVRGNKAVGRTTTKDDVPALAIYRIPSR